jgi:hypothetical protein
MDDFFNSKSFGGYAGKALMIFALVGPMSHCAAQDQSERNSFKVMELQLQKSCMEAHGNWSSWYDSCSFED